jgi:arylsulfatase
MGQPNILHIFTDMQRADTIAVLGNTSIRTPNLDRLCSDGVAFTSAYSPSPVCISARCSMIHGQYPHNTGCYQNSPMPSDGRQTFMDVLAGAGYQTHGIGKCHFSPERYSLRGFHEREVQEEGGAGMADLSANPYLKYLHELGYGHLCEAYGVRGEMYYIPQPSQVPAEHHPSQWVGDRSIAYIGDAASRKEPWYLFSSFIHPHPPFTPPNPWHKLYRPTMMPLPLMPENAEALLTFVNHVQNRYKYRDQGRDLNLIRAIKAYYYACISFIDYQVGRIMTALEESGQLDDTLVVFTSDHGEFLGDYGCWGKRSMHDPAARVPMIARMPGAFDGGRRIDTPVSLVDLAPTFASVAGADFDSHTPDGTDLREIVSGGSQREYVFSQLSVTGGLSVKAQGGQGKAEILTAEDRVAAGSSYMCLSKEWKYVYSAPDDREYLFDRVRDPLETRNRVGVEFCAQALAKHKTALLDHLIRGGETAGIADGQWRSFPRRQVDTDPDTGLLIQDSYTPWADMSIPGYTD